MSLHEKMYNVMCESEALKKEMQVGSGSYNYKAISEAEVLNSVKPLLKKHKLILFPVSAEIVEHEDRKMSQLTAKYKIVDTETGEFELLATVGNGSDTQDKGSGKAWTYAYKALLQKTFMLFSGEDTDNTHSDDIGKQNIKPETKKASVKAQYELTGAEMKNFETWYTGQVEKGRTNEDMCQMLIQILKDKESGTK